jgi:hypothetical protein
MIYIGKGDNLRRRLKQFSEFGSGKPIGHWGGRLVWQVQGSADFVVSWKTSRDGDDPRMDEILLMDQFRAQYGRLPFANLVG